MTLATIRTVALKTHYTILQGLGGNVYVATVQAQPCFLVCLSQNLAGIIIDINGLLVWNLKGVKHHEAFVSLFN